MLNAATPPSAALPVSLMPLKLVVPSSREGVALRPDLRALIAELRIRPVTLVTAPAGYGKTTVLVQWARELERTGATIGWLAIDATDRDAVTILSYLVRAVQSALPGLGDQAWRALNTVADLNRNWPLIAGALCAEFQQRLREPLFLFLDDLHSISDSPIMGPLLGYLLRAAPPNLHFILASRRPLTFAPLPRMRAEGQVLEVGQRELRLNGPDARTLLARQGVALASEDLDALLSRTEGWALSIQLAARALAAQPPQARSAFVRTLGGGQQQIFEYLVSEVQSDLPPILLEFLQLAALPDHFDAALLSEALQRSGTHSLLAQALALGLPLSALEERGDRYRLHPLWRDLLLESARARLDPETWRELHRRYGQAFEARGNLLAALEHFVIADATEHLARALRSSAWPLLNSPQRDNVRRWIELLPAELCELDPELLHMWGVSYLVLDPATAISKITRASELYRQSNQPRRELRALGDLAALQFWKAQSPEFEQTCRQAVAAANRADDAWAPGAALVAAAALLYRRGRAAGALRVAARAARRPLNPFWQWLLAMVVADLATRLGRPQEMLSTVDEALRVTLIDQDERLRQNLLRYRGLALAFCGRLEEALSTAREAQRHLNAYAHDGTTSACTITLAHILLEMKRVDEALVMLAQARAELNALGDQAALAQVQALEIVAQSLQPGQHEAAAIRVEAALEALNQAGDPLDFTARLMLAIVLGSGNREAIAESMLDELLPQMARSGCSLPLAAGRLYRAYLAGRRGDATRRRIDLRAGWELMEADRHSYLPWLPAEALDDVLREALQLGIGIAALERILRRQLIDTAATLLIDLLNDSDAAVRTRAAELLGQLGLASAYPALRNAARDRSVPVRQAAEQALTRLVYRPPYLLRVRTLGAFAVWRGDEEVRDREWRSVKARQLFQLLLTERGRMISRDRIIDALWPEMELEAAANNLRVTISRLGKALEPDRPDGAPLYYVVQHSDTFGLNTAGGIELDLDLFTRSVEQGRQLAQEGRRAPAIEALRRAISLYGGTYLPDSLYEDWTVVERARLGLLFNEAALLLGNLLLADGLAHEAVGVAWRVLEHEQAQEEAYRLLMRAHARLGERSTALRLYANCVRALQEELGVEPMPETTALYQQIRAMPEELIDIEVS